MGDDTAYRISPASEPQHPAWGPGPAPAGLGGGPGTPPDPTAVIGRRIGQYLLDSLLVTAGLVVPSIVLGIVIAASGTDPGVIVPASAVIVAVLLSWSVFAWWPHRHGGRTPAMGWLGLRIVSEDGTPAGLGTLTLRWLMLLVDGFCYGLVGLIVMAASRAHRRLGDVVAGTVVVRVDAPVPTPVGPPTGPVAGGTTGPRPPLPAWSPTPGAWAPPPVPPAAPPRRRRIGLWIAVAAIALVVVLGAVVGIVALVASRPAPPPPPPAVFTARPLGLPLNNPANLAVSPDGSRVYIANRGTPQNPGSTLSVLDTATDTVVGTLPAGPFPADITLSPDGQRAYVMSNTPDGSPGTVTAVDIDHQALLGSVTVGQNPGGAAIAPDGRTLYVPNTGAFRPDTPGSTVSVIDTATMTTTATVTVGPEPVRAAVTGDGRDVYVANYGTAEVAGDTVAVIDTATNVVTNTVTVGGTPSDLAMSPDGRTVYVADGGSTVETRGDVTMIDTATKGTQPLPAVPGGGVPVGLGLVDGGARLLVVKQQNGNVPGNSLALLDATTHVATDTLAVGDDPYRVAVTPDGHHAYLMTAPSTGQVIWTVDIP